MDMDSSGEEASMPSREQAQELEEVGDWWLVAGWLAYACCLL